MTEKCILCNLGQDCQKNKIGGEGSDLNPILFVGEAPGEEEDIVGRPFIGESGKLLRKHLTDIFGADYLSIVRITNAVRCRPKENKSPGPKQINSCFVHLKEEIKEVSPICIVVLGNIALKSVLKKVGIIRSRGKISGYYTQMGNVEGKKIPVFSMYHPAYILRNPHLENVFSQDMEELRKIYLNNFKEKQELGEYIIINSLADLHKLWSKLKELNDQYVSFDIETNDIVEKGKEHFPNPHRKDAEIVCFSICFEEKKAYSVIWHHKDSKLTDVDILPFLVWFCESDLKKIAHNGKFDFGYLKSLFPFITLKNFVFDTMLAHYLLDLTKGTHGLKDLAKNYTKMGDYDKDLHIEFDSLKGKKRTYQDLDLNTVCRYNALDADATFRLYRIFIEELKNKKLDRLFYTFMMPLTHAIMSMEIKGIKIDIDYYKKIKNQYQNELIGSLKKLAGFEEVKKYIIDRSNFEAFAKKEEELLREMAICKEEGINLSSDIDSILVENKKATKKKIVALANSEKKYQRLQEKLAKLKEKNIIEVNFNSPLQIREIIFNYLHNEKEGRELLKPVHYTETGLASVGVDVLEIYKEKHEFIKELLIYRKLAKLLSTYINPVSSIWCDKDNFVHTNFNLHGTESGRLSSSRPNLQNLPRTNKDIKKLFISRFTNEKKGKIIELDLSQAELRILALYSQDPILIKAYQEDKDIHSMTASLVFGIDADIIQKEYEDLRSIGKKFNFAIIYGMSPITLAADLTSILPTDKIVEIKNKAASAYVELSANLRKTLKDVDYHNWQVKNSFKNYHSDSIQGNLPSHISVEAYNLAAFIFSIYFTKFSKIGEHIENVKKYLFNNYKISSLFNLTRYFPRLAFSTKTSDWKLKKSIEEDIKSGVNHIIQSSATYLCLFALIRLHNLIQLKGLQSNIIVTVHDSIVIECEESEMTYIKEKAKEFLEDTNWFFEKIKYINYINESDPYILPWNTDIKLDSFNIPIKSDCKIGNSWGDIELEENYNIF